MNQEVSKVSKGETLQGCKVSPWSRGFTLIELLVVIAILGILSAGILTAINVTSNLDKARIAKAKTFSKSLENSLSVAQVGKWSFDNQSTPGIDTSGNGNNGTVNGATWQNASDCSLGFGGCLSFNGSTDEPISVNDSQSLSLSDDMTISAWIKPINLSTQHVLARRDACNFANYQLHINNGGTFGFYSRSDIASTSTLKSGVWTFVVASVTSSGQVKLYINGKLDKEGSVALAVLNSNPGLKIGDSGTCPGTLFNGSMDEVAIYNQALTASQIHHLYAQKASYFAAR